MIFDNFCAVASFIQGDELVFCWANHSTLKCIPEILTKLNIPRRLFFCILEKYENSQHKNHVQTGERSISRWENVKYSIRWLVYSNNGSHVKRFKWWLITFIRFNMHLILNARTHLFGFLIQNGIIKSTSNTPIYSPYISFNIAIIKVSKDISTVYIIHDCCFVCCYVLVYLFIFFSCPININKRSEA